MFDTAWILGKDGAADALALRKAVFIDELGFADEAVFDGRDACAAHLIVCEDGLPIASGRMRPDDGGVRLDYICVAKQYRSQGYGDLCLRVMLDKARRMGTKSVCICVREEQTPYYTAFGFAQSRRCDNGAICLTIAPEDINWHPSCKE